MTRPGIVRADSIDLQGSEEVASAKTHKSAKAMREGSLAPHQAETLREVEEERAEEEARSPRVSWNNGDAGDIQQYAQDLASSVSRSLNGASQQDDLAVAQNGGHGHDDDDDLDSDGDDDLDDDMADRISSSPSIEDGAYTLRARWPRRVDSLNSSIRLGHSPSPSEANGMGSNLSHPHPAEHEIPLQDITLASKACLQHPHPRHHLLGEYIGSPDDVEWPDDKMTESYRLQHDSSMPQDDQPGSTAAGLVEQVASGNEGSNRKQPVVVRIEDFSLDPSMQGVLLDSDLDLDEERHFLSPYDFLIPYDGSSEDDDDFSLVDDPRCIDSGWGGECLQDAEDIDFEFVYALHTFVATVEGQANATKGDTMVLLDDSNSYWWLVRVVKDSSIGYLPAEHIETPTERLARLNKHRNIDLSATMLGDQAEKTKNPIKTAMRRRKAKTVTFTAPTYVDYSDIDYSSDEAEGDGETDSHQQVSQQAQEQQAQQEPQESVTQEIEDDESAKVEPLKPRSQQKQAQADGTKMDEKDETDGTQSERRSSDDIFDVKPERTTRNGTVRNTDSFFKDDSIETKKITLTPGLLRDDSNDPRGSNDSKELRQRASFEKELMADKTKDDKKKKDTKKEKEKKPSAIRSFFSRKDKKKSADDDDESFGKRSMDASLDGGEVDDVDMDTSPEKAAQRGPSKLQKQQPRAEPSPTRKPSITAPQPNNVANVPPATMRVVEPEASETSVEPSLLKEATPKSGISKILQSNSESKPPKVTKAKSRVELDDFDSSSQEDEIVSAPTRAPPAEPPRQREFEEAPMRPTLPGAFPDSYMSNQTSTSQHPEVSPGALRPSEDAGFGSPMRVSPVTSSNPPGLMGDNSSQEERSSPVSSPSPELVHGDEKTHRAQDSLATSTSSSTWNDASLRSFFDSGSDIRDLLVVVYDKTDVPPAGPDHPIAGPLFREQNAKLAEITTQLDNMLGDWLARKQRLRGTF